MFGDLLPLPITKTTNESKQKQIHLNTIVSFGVCGFGFKFGGYGEQTAVLLSYTGYSRSLLRWPGAKCCDHGPSILQ
eukprot:1830322-Amphidinium_carterae.1